MTLVAGSASIRLVLAFALAVWSPAWTCCCLMGATCGPNGAATADATPPAACCSMAPGERPAEPSGCCATRARRGSQDPAAPDSPCRCGDHDRDLALDRAALPHPLGEAAPAPPAPVVSRTWLAPALPPGRGAPPDPGRTTAPMPRADSLFARACLLTI
jgi:hypothetical protein